MTKRRLKLIKQAEKEGFSTEQQSVLEQDCLSYDEAKSCYLAMKHGIPVSDIKTIFV